MPDLRFLQSGDIADEVQEEQTRVDTAGDNSLEGLLPGVDTGESRGDSAIDGLLDAPRPQGGRPAPLQDDRRRDIAEGFAQLPFGQAGRPPDADRLDFPELDQPIPRDLPAARAAARQRGESYEVSASAWVRARDEANLLAANLFAKAGIGLDEVDNRDWDNVVAAYTWLASRLRAPLADEEQGEFVRVAAEGLLGKGRDAILGRLQELESQAGTRDPDQLAPVVRDEIQSLQNAFGLITQELSLVQQGEPAAIERFARLTRDYLRRRRGDELTRLRREADGRLLDDLIPRPPGRPAVTLMPGEGGASGAPVFEGRVERTTTRRQAREFAKPAWRRLEDALDVALNSSAAPENAADAAALAYKGALRETRLRRMGIPSALVDAGGLQASILHTHGNTVISAFDRVRARREAQKRGEAPPDFVSAGQVQLSRAQRNAVGGLLTAALSEPSPEAQLAALDPQQNALAALPGFRRALEAGTIAVEDVTNLIFGAVAFAGRALNTVTRVANDATQSLAGIADEVGTSIVGATGLADRILARNNLRQNPEVVDLVGLPEADAAAIREGVQDGSVPVEVLANLVRGGDGGDLGAFVVSLLSGLSRGAVSPDEPEFQRSRLLTALNTEMVDAPNALEKTAAERLSRLAGKRISPALARELVNGGLSVLVDRTIPGSRTVVAEKGQRETLAQSRERLERQYVQASAAYRKGNLGEGVMIAIGTMMEDAFVSTKELAGLFVKDPETAAGIVGFSWAAGTAGAPVVRSLTGQVGTALHRGALRRRILRGWRTLLEHEPEVAGRLREVLKTTNTRLSEKSLREIDALLDKLSTDALRDAQDIAVVTQDEATRFRRRQRRAINRFDRLIRKADIGELTDLLDSAGLPEIALQLANAGPTSPIAAFIDDVLVKAGTKTDKVLPTIRAKLRNVAEEALSAINEGGSLQEVTSIMFPMSGAGFGAVNNMRRLLARVPGLRGLFTIEDFAKTNVVREAAEIVNDVAEAAVGLRDLNELTIQNQLDILDVARAEIGSELHDVSLDLLSPERRDFVEGIGADPAVDRAFREAALRSRAEKLAATQRRLNDLRTEVENRDWRKQVKLSTQRVVLDNLSLNQIYTWLRLEHAPERIWGSAARRAKGATEGPQDFTARVEELVDLEQQINERALTGRAAERAGQRIRKQKRELLRAFFDRQAVSDDVRIDLKTRSVLAFHEADELVARRRATAEAAEFETGSVGEAARRAVAANPRLFDPETGFGVESKRVLSGLGRLEDIEKTLRIQQRGALYSSSGAFDFGDLGLVIKNTREMTQRFRQDTKATVEQIENFWDNIEGLTGEQRAAFDLALADLANGDAASWRAWTEANRDLLVDAGLAGTPAERLGAAFARFEGMRASLLKLARDSGLITPDAYDDFVKPYSPQLYELNEFPSVASERMRQVFAGRGIDEAGRVDFGDLSEFELDRDLYKHRVRVFQEGSTWLTRKFNTRDEAVAWVQERVGLNKAEAMDGDIGLKGRTDLDDRVVILDPLGEDTAAQLGLVGRAESLGRQVLKLASDIGMQQFVRLFDRPGWRLTEEAFRTAQEAGTIRPNEWVKLNSAESFGPLRGRWVPKKVVNAIAEYTRAFNGLNDFANTFGEVGTATEAAAGVGPLRRMWYRTSDLMRNLITGNLISRNFRTILNNVWSDNWFFARLAAGTEVLHDKQALRDAMRALFGVDSVREGLGLATTRLDADLTDAAQAGTRASKNFFDPEASLHIEDPLILEAIEDGILGDSFAGSALTGRMRRRWVELVYGKSDTSPIMRRIFRWMQADEEGGFAAGVAKAFGADDGEAQIARLQQRVDQIRSQLERHEAGEIEIPAGRRARMLEQRLAFEAEISRAQARGMLPAMKRMFEGFKWFTGLRQNFGTFDEVRNFSHQFYTRVSQVGRLRAYLHMRRKGITREVARERIRDFTQDYSNLPAWVSGARRSPFANPIFSFPFELTRVWTNVLIQHPEFIIGALTAAPMISMVSAAANGVDPENLWSFATRDGKLSGITQFVGGIYVPTPDGKLSYMSLPVFNPLQLFEKPMGPLGTAADYLERQGGAAGTIGSLGARFAGKFFGMNPMMDVVTRLGFGTDPLTGQQIGGGFPGRVSSTIEGLGRFFVPGSFPIWSNTSDAMLSTLRTGPLMNSERRVSAHERFLQTTLGVKIRGGFVEQVLGQSTAGLKLDEGLRMVLELMGAADRVDPRRFASELIGVEKAPVFVPKRLPPDTGLGWEDVARQMLYSSAKFDVGTEFRAQGLDNTFFEDMRHLQDLRRWGIETNDPKLVAGLDREIARQRKLAEQYWRDNEALTEIGGRALELEITSRDFDLWRKAGETLNLNQKWLNSGILRQTWTLIGLSRLGAPEDVWNSYYLLTLYGAEAEAGRRKTRTQWSSPERVLGALEILDRYLAEAPEDATGLGPLQVLRRDLGRRFPRTLEQEQRERTSTPLKREVYFDWKRRTRQ